MTDWTIVTRSLTARMFSTVTTVITVAVAVGLLLVLLMMRESGSRAFERGTGNIHILVSRDQSALVSVLNGMFYAGAPKNALLYPEYEKIAKSAPYEFAIPAQLGDSYRGLWPVLATEETYFTRFQPAEATTWKFAQGRAFAKNFEVVIGAAAARATGLKLNQKIVLTHGAGAGPNVHEHSEYSYEVVGILEPTGTAHDRALFTNLTSTWILHAFDRRERAEAAEAAKKPVPAPVDDHDHAHDDDHKHDKAHDHADEHDHAHEEPLTEADLLSEDRKITNIFLRVATRPGSDVSASIGPIFDSLRRDTSLTVASPTREIGKLFAIVSNIDQIFVAMAGVVMVSSGIAIMVALYNSMEQRRRQIAVLRVLGASRGRIFNLVVTESAVIGVIGAIAGVLLAIIGARLVAEVMKQRLGLVIEPAVSPQSILFVVLITIALAALAGVIPAVMAYRTGVSRNLRPIG